MNPGSGSHAGSGSSSFDEPNSKPAKQFDPFAMIDLLRSGDIA
jgi:hypothetical protein